MSGTKKLTQKEAVKLAIELGKDISLLPYKARRAIFEAAGAELPLDLLYGDDPLRFAYDVFNEQYTEDVANLLNAAATCNVVLARSATAVGKTYAAAALVVWWALCKPASQAWVTAAPPETNLRNLLWPQIERRYWSHKYLFDARGWTLQRLLLRRPWSETDGEKGTEDEAPMVVGVRIPISGTDKQKEAKFSGKHARNLLFVVDEGDAVPDAVYRGIDGCMSGGNVSLVVLFNPREQAGPVWDLERDQRAAVVELSAFRHPNVITGENIIPGAVTREITTRRIYEWTTPCTTEDDDDPSIFRVPDFLVGCTATRADGVEYLPLGNGLRRIVDPQFAYKVLGVYPPVSTTDQVFDPVFLRQLLKRAKSVVPERVIKPGMGLAGECIIYREPKPGLSYVIGVDTAEGRNPHKGDFCVFDVIEKASGEQVAHYKSRVDPHTFAGDIAAVGLHYNTAVVAVELNNHGHAVVEALVSTHSYPNIYMNRDGRRGIQNSHRVKAQLIDTLAGTLTAMRAGADKGITINCPETIEQMLTFARLPGGSMGGRHGAYDDCVTSIAIAWYVTTVSSYGQALAAKYLPDPLVLYR